jgi:hypothetical protein
MDLNHARLPIPPLRQVDYVARQLKQLPVRKNNPLFYRRFPTCQTITSTTEPLTNDISKECTSRGTRQEEGLGTPPQNPGKARTIVANRWHREKGHGQLAEAPARNRQSAPQPGA